MKIKAITFDFWDTLYKGNSDNRLKRNHYLYSVSSAENVGEVEIVINKTKKSLESNMERLGIAYTSEFFWDIIAKHLRITYRDLQTFHKFSKDNFLANPPISIFEDKDLIRLSEDYKLGIISNTLSIPGNTIRQFIGNQSVFKSTIIQDSIIFSDEVGCAKPNYKIFKIAHSKIPYLSEEILHIGDNSRCDVEGAKNYGFNTLFLKDGFNYEKIINKIKTLE